MEFHKYHALGNDYLVLPGENALPATDAIIRICHRNFGLGSDGILHGPLPSTKADFGLTIWNPDGSEAEKSGNGLRIFCRYLFDQGQVAAGQPFTVDTLGGVVEATVHPGGGEVTVEMGRVTFSSGAVGMEGEEREALEETIELAGTNYVYSAASIGNPHCVFVLPEISAELAHRLGPLVENAPRFRHRTNVQFLKVLARDRIQIEIWERGAGYTLASGSSSSAAAAVARKLGLIDEVVTVQMPGGELAIKMDDAFAVTMRGPVTRVATMALDPEALA